MQKIKKLFLILLLLESVFTYLPALAANPVPDYTTSGVQKGIETYLCTPSATTGASGNNDLYTCINKLYKFVLIFASVMAIFFTVIAGYVYMSAEGNAESVEKAKGIFVSSLTALVILFSAYILLRAINPDLVSFKTFQPYDINYSSNGGLPSLPEGTAPAGATTSTCNPSFGGTASSGCSGQSCVNVSAYTSSHDCSSNGGSCLLSSQAAQKAQNLINNYNQSGSSCNLKISAAIEGANGPSVSACHKNGTCADFNLIPYNSTCAQAFYNAARSAGAVSLLDEYVAACVAQSTTGGNIHVNF